MRCATNILLLTLFLFVGSAQAANVRPGAIDGYWRVASGDAVIHITAANDRDRYIGHIVWLAEPFYSAAADDGISGQPKVDRKNPDHTLRSRPLVGLKLLWGLRFDGQEKWVDGDIYDLESGKTYHCEAWLSGHNKLKVHGYIGIAFFGGTTTWQRAGPPPF